MSSGAVETDSSWRTAAFSPLTVTVAGWHRDVVDALAARRLAGQHRQDGQGRVGQLPGHVGADAHGGRLDLDAGHERPQLVEGLERDVLVDVDAAGIDDEAALDAADVLEAGAGPADGGLVGLGDDGAELDALGDDARVDDHRPDPRHDLVEPDADAGWRVARDADPGIDREDVDRRR